MCEQSLYPQTHVIQPYYRSDGMCQLFCMIYKFIPVGCYCFELRCLRCEACSGLCCVIYLSNSVSGAYWTHHEVYQYLHEFVPLSGLYTGCEALRRLDRGCQTSQDLLHHGRRTRASICQPCMETPFSNTPAKNAVWF